MATFPPPWESGPGPADPGLSSTFGSYTGSGYGPPIGSSLAGIQAQKTLYPGPVQAQAMGAKANLVWRVDQNGVLWAYDAVSNLTFQP
jgi:hypothetical protein